MYAFEPVRGKSHALNRALALARGDILLFTDDDVRFPAQWIEEMCDPIVNCDADAVAGGVLLARHILRPWMNRTHRAWLSSTADYLDSEEPSELCGANMAIKRTVFDRIGGFDPELGPGVTGGGEESLLSWQVKRAGYKVQGNLSVSVEHHPAADRLQYASWIRAAQNKGAAQAYLLHHWFHRRIRFPRIKRFWVLTKLVLRRLVTTRRRPGEEGISPWELSYVADCSMYERYQRERLRARHYSPTEIRKLESDRLSGSA
jgi:GT2 family glycosyltransferase